MEIPKYIVFRVDVMKHGTSVELTNITDDVEDVILKERCEVCGTHPQCEECRYWHDVMSQKEGNPQ